VPTGIALRDAREQLSDAAERILLRDGPSALTSRAVTAEAGVAKGVLHRHFADFDAFLAELVLDRMARLQAQADTLQLSAGTGTVAGNLTDALIAMFSPVAVRIINLIFARDALRVRLREAGAARVPLLGEGTAVVAAYLTAEQERGRFAAGADIATLAPTLIGAVHLLFTDREGPRPDADEVGRVVATVLASAT
jgi:AcrR family transcriptional regulator